MHKTLFLSFSFIVATTAFTLTEKAIRSFDCPAENCSYLPLIGNPPAVVVYELHQAITRAGTFRFTGDVLASKPVYDVVVEVRHIKWRVLSLLACGAQSQPAGPVEPI